MTNETRSPEEIEREIEAQRSSLTSNLEDLQDKFSIDTVVRQIREQFSEHGGDMGRSISDQVKANPIPLALTGIGLAWMMFGGGKKPFAASGVDQRDYSTPEHDFRQSRVEQGRVYTPPTSRVTQPHDGPSWSYDDDFDDEPSVGDKLASGAASAKDQTAQGIASARDGAASAASTISDKASSASESISDAAASAKASIASGAHSARGGLNAAGRRIAEGTETLSEEGRMRVIAARQKAVQMQRKAARSVNDGADAAADFYDRQPLVIGALALAVGAALGGAMPRTKTEDDLMGAHSDNLYSEAERIFEEEKSKVLTVAKSVKSEVKDIASETRADLDSGAPGEKSAVDAVGDTAKSMVDRVASKAQATAKAEKLGKPKT